MRDLKADSEQIQNFRSKWRQSTEYFCREKAELWAELWLDQALAEKERADKAEALARELVEALEVAFELLEDHQPNWYLRMHFNQINNALGSYKEVLGDGN